MKTMNRYLSAAFAAAIFYSFAAVDVLAQSSFESFGDQGSIQQASLSVRLGDDQCEKIASLRFSDETSTEEVARRSESCAAASVGNSPTSESIQTKIQDERESQRSIDYSCSDLFWADSIYHFPVSRKVPKLVCPTLNDQSQILQPVICPNADSAATELSPLPGVPNKSGMLRPISNTCSLEANSLCGDKGVSSVGPQRNPLRPICANHQDSVEPIPAQVNKLEPPVVASWSLQETASSQALDDETSLLKAFPVADLHAGIPTGSFQRACGNRVIADPNYQFLASAYQAPHHWGSGCLSWKTWESPNVRYRPLLFEEENVERYGQHAGYYLQPYVSGVHFFGSVVALPYKIASDGWIDCEYGLGYYRPGNCNPAYRKRINRSARGLILQTATVGAVLAL